MIGTRAYDWLNKDTKYEKNVKLLASQQKIINKQTIALNQFDVDKERQRVAENELYLGKMAVTIEKQRLSLKNSKSKY